MTILMEYGNVLEPKRLHLASNAFREMPNMNANHFSSSMVTIKSGGEEHGLLIAGGSSPRTRISEYFTGRGGFGKGFFGIPIPIPKSPGFIKS